MARLASLICGSLVFGAGLVGVSSCGGGDGDAASTGAAATTSGGAGGSTAIECKSDPASLDLGGTWAAYGRLSISLAGAPGGAINICPTDQIGEASMLLLLTFTGDPADATKISEAKATLCSLGLPVLTALVGACDPNSDSLVQAQIVVPDTLINALPKIATQSVKGSLTGAADGSAVDLDRFTVTVGTTKQGDMMPKWNADDQACADPKLGRTSCEMSCVDDCSAMRDDDMDTFPGVTVHVCGVTPDDIKKGLLCSALMPNEPGTTLQGAAYLDIQVDPKFAGTAKNSCEITGNVDTSVLYNVIGADVFLAGGAISVSSAIKSLPQFNVDTTKSNFRMVRIDGKYGAPDWGVNASNAALACKTLIMRENEL